MTRNQVQLMVDELAEDLRAHVFQALDAEIWINGDEAGRVAGAIERAFRHRYAKLPVDREAALRAAVKDEFDRFDGRCTRNSCAQEWRVGIG
jgi:hypothetical protein